MDIIFDIDGTLADLTHRRHFVLNKPKDWKSFNAAMGNDGVHAPVAMLARQLKTLANRIILCSGREEVFRDVTEAWLVDKVWGEWPNSRHHALYMRKAKDYRADDVIKEELLDQIIADGFRPQMAFDDRDRVVAMWRRRGLVCCQVAEGNF